MKKKFILLMLVVLVLFIGIEVDAKELGFNIMASCEGYFGNPNNPKSLMGIIVEIFDLIKISLKMLILYGVKK